MACYDTYRDQLASLYYGHALWVPDPSELYDRVRVGDVGYVKQGHFNRMFNALLPAKDDVQEYGVPEGFVPLNMGPFKNIRKLNLFQGDYCSNTVRVDQNRHQATDPDEVTNTFKCSRNNKGAFLSLPLNGVREDATRTKAFEAYIRTHCDSWLEFASANEIDVRLEDIIFVTGCDLTASWAMAAFVNSLDQEVSLNVRVSEAGSARFQWDPTSQPHHNEPNQNVVKSHCVFIRGFRAKRILPFYKTLKAAAEPRPDSPDNEPESSIELLREPAVPDYRDPLVGILDYIAEQCPDQELAITHEDDLKRIGRLDVLTADAVEIFLRQNKILVQAKKGVAFLVGGDGEVHEEEKTSFRARADVDGEQLPLIIHPILMEYLLKIDLTSQPPDFDFGVPNEELVAPAVHPPVHLLVLENERGLPQNIEVHASNKRSEIGITIEDVLKALNVYLRKPAGQRERAEDHQRAVNLLAPFLTSSLMNANLQDTLPPTVEGTLAVCPRFRILVVGNTGVGKSSLVSSIFNIDIKDTDIAHGRAGKADISRAYTSDTNPRFILHDSQGFEPGSLEKWEVVEGFIRDKCDERLEPKDRLHCIWLCIETPGTGSRLMQTADEEVLKLATNLNVAVIVVFTKYDVLFNEHYRAVKATQSPSEPASTDTIRTYAEARAEGHLDALVKTFQPRFEYVTVSTHKRYPNRFNMLKGLAETTRRCLHEVEGDLWVPWAAAQQIDAQQKVNFSINEGFKEYWINLGKSTVFPGYTLSDCLSRIHLDIIEVWNFYDPDKLLSGVHFRGNMIKLIEPLLIIESRPSDTLSTLSGLSSTATAPFAQVLSGVGIAVVAVKFLYQKYQAIPSTARCLGAYIVDLTLILHDLFIGILANKPPRPLNWELIADALKNYKVSHAGKIHQQIGDIVSGMGVLPKEKIADLIHEHLDMDKE